MNRGCHLKVPRNGGVDMQATELCEPWCYNSQDIFLLQGEFGTVMTPWWQWQAKANDAKTALCSLHNVRTPLYTHNTAYTSNFTNFRLHILHPQKTKDLSCLGVLGWCRIMLEYLIQFVGCFPPSVSKGIHKMFSSGKPEKKNPI